jgi:hypothetical protein
MLTAFNTRVEDSGYGNVKVTHYECDEAITLAGDSIWDCTITSADEVRIKDIYIEEGIDAASDGLDGNTDYRHISVYYTVNGIEEFEESWRIYTDSGFANAVSELLDFTVFFTEQGMQADGVASME